MTTWHTRDAYMVTREKNSCPKCRFRKVFGCNPYNAKGMLKKWFQFLSQGIEKVDTKSKTSIGVSWVQMEMRKMDCFLSWRCAEISLKCVQNKFNLAWCRERVHTMNFAHNEPDQVKCRSIYKYMETENPSPNSFLKRSYYIHNNVGKLTLASNTVPTIKNCYKDRQHSSKFCFPHYNLIFRYIIPITPNNAPNPHAEQIVPMCCNAQLQWSMVLKV